MYPEQNTAPCSHDLPVSYQQPLRNGHILLLHTCIVNLSISIKENYSRTQGGVESSQRDEAQG